MTLVVFVDAKTVLSSKMPSKHMDGDVFFKYEHSLKRSKRDTDAIPMALTAPQVVPFVEEADDYGFGFPNALDQYYQSNYRHRIGHFGW